MARVRSLLPWLALSTSACAGDLASEAHPDVAPASASARAAEAPAAVSTSPAPSAQPETAPPRNVANAAPDAAEPADEPLVFDSRWADAVREVAVHYQGWGRIDDEARWAPELCRMPQAARARVSQSDDPGTHGHKLYTLYVMDPVAYGSRRSAMGGTRLESFSQVVVKEAFEPVPLDQLQDGKRGGFHPGGGRGVHGLEPAVEDGVAFVAGDRKGLFVMMRPKGATEGTDAGWIYATVEPDMMTIGAVGVIASCAGCHAEAGDGRLFGLPDLPSTGPGAGTQNAPR